MEAQVAQAHAEVRQLSEQHGRRLREVEREARAASAADVEAALASQAAAAAQAVLRAQQQPPAQPTVIIRQTAPAVAQPKAHVAADPAVTAPTSAAMWHAVTPRESNALGSAPACRRTLTNSVFVCPQPAISAVNPS